MSNKTVEEQATRKVYRDMHRLLKISTAVMIVSLCIAIAGLYFARQALIPIALALLLATILSSSVEALHRWKIPRGVGASLVLLTILSLCGLVLNAITVPAEEWFANLPRTLQILERKVRPVEQVLKRLETVGNRATALAAPSVGTRSNAPASPNATSVTAFDVLMWTRSGLINTVTVLIVTLFLLSAGPPVLARMTSALVHDLQAVGVIRIIEAIRIEVGRYYATIALINLGLGIATGITMTLLGMPNPVLWGTMAAVFNFVPYVGSATTLLVLTTVAAVTFDTIGQVLAVIASYLSLATIEGQIVQPLLVGHRLEINPLVVFLAVWFGGWLWGVAGIIMAVPILVVIKVAAEHSRNGHPIVVFLGQAHPTRLKESLSLGAFARHAKRKELVVPPAQDAPSTK